MDKDTFIKTLSGRLERKPEDIKILIDGFSSLIKEKCGNLSTVAIPGFGEFVPVKDEERVELNADGKRMLLPPQVRLTFEPSSIFKAKKIYSNNAKKSYKKYFQQLSQLAKDNLTIQAKLSQNFYLLICFINCFVFYYYRFKSKYLN